MHDLDARQVVAIFDGGHVASDAGGLLLREIEARFDCVGQFARCCTDTGNQGLDQALA